MCRKISIIGAGNVGATIANDLVLLDIAQDILLIDVNKNKAVGEALDIYQGATFHSPTIVRPGDYEDAEGSDIVIITCGRARQPGMSRLDLAQCNVDILKQITPHIVKAAPDAIYIIVSNPVDIMTYAFCKFSGLPEKQIIGSGTILDTSRLQSELAKRFHISPKNVHAHVYGEHGDTAFIPWSMAHIANNHIDAYELSAEGEDRINWNRDYQEVEDHVRKSGAKIIQNKGATHYAVAMSVCHLCKCIYNGAGTALTVSTMFHGEYGISDVCLSALTLVDRKGIRGIIKNTMTDGETALMRKSANALRDVISGLTF